MEEKNALQLVKVSQRNFLKKLKAKTKLYFVQVRGVKIILLPGVFPPRTDTRLMAAHLIVSKGSKVLDLGTGSGVLAVLAGLGGATGVAVDINPQAVANARKNFAKYDLQINAILSDTFANVPQEMFDYILATPPYLDAKVREPLTSAIYGMKNFVSKLFTVGPKYLSKNGRIWATFAEWSDVDFFENLIKENGLSFRILGKKKSSDGQRVYRLYEITKPI